MYLNEIKSVDMEQHKYKFSIGIPAYKSRYLEECIKSVLSQTYTNFELIIVNDNSPEPIEEIVERFLDDRILYSKNEYNIGAENVVDNWNKCSDKATGDFFVLLGDDDLMMPNYLEEFLKLIDRYPTLDVFHCRSFIIDEEGTINSMTLSWPEYETVYENIYHRIKEHRVQYISDFMYRLSTLKQHGGFYKLPLAWASDDISAYIAAGKKGIAHTQEPVFCYRMSGYTISSTGNRDLKMKAIIREEQWISNFLKLQPLTSLEQTFHTLICAYYKLYIQKKKIRTITLSFNANNNSILNLLSWYSKRKQYYISINELVYAYLEYLKKIIVSKKYNS
ncbi:hypothetical protein GCM10027035_41210 [Emticicia sediminis]